MTTKLGSRPRPAGTGERRAPVVRRLSTVREFDEAVRVLCEVWHTDTAEDLVNASLMVSWAMSDNYVAGVYRDDEMVGAAVAFRGADHLHSHMAGIHPKHQGAGLGFLLKQDERDWARERGLRFVRWTFDPLVRRNAHFNLSKLRTRALTYHENLYGKLNDGLNDGDDTDRLLIEWDVTAADASRPRVEESGAALVGPAWLDPRAWDAASCPDATVVSPDGSVRLLLTPYDVESLRLHEPQRAAQWRQAVRRGFRSARDAGHEVVGFTSDGCYVLRRP